jgi:flavin-binding protein dodecin
LPARSAKVQTASSSQFSGVPIHQRADHDRRTHHRNQQRQQREVSIVQAVERANNTLKNVKGAWVKDQEVTIDNGKGSGYKVVLKVTFILSD